MPELQLMQGLAQKITINRPELLNGEAIVGELAWVWAKDRDTLGQFWQLRMWHDKNSLIAWA